MPINTSKSISSVSYNGINIPIAETIGSGEDEIYTGDATLLHIEIAAEGIMEVPIMFSQSIANGVTVDWGDGSTTETYSETSATVHKHTYSAIGKYTIRLLPQNSCQLTLGNNTSSNNCIMGPSGSSSAAYTSMLKKVDVGKKNTTINRSLFYYCYGLSSVNIQSGININSTGVCRGCYSLSAVNIAQGITRINNDMFYTCYSIPSITIPSSVTTIGTYAFYNCYGVKYYDFSKHTSVPTLSGTNAFTGISSGCQIRVPSSLLSSWKTATNWSNYASYMVGV